MKTLERVFSQALMICSNARFGVGTSYPLPMRLLRGIRKTF